MKTLNRGQWGVTQDDAGRLYRNVNTEALFVDLVPAPYYVRNPDRDDGAHNFYTNGAEFETGVQALRKWERERDARP